MQVTSTWRLSWDNWTDFWYQNYYNDLDDREPSKAFHNDYYTKSPLFGSHKNLFGSQDGSGHALGETNNRFILAHLFLFFSMLFFYFCHALCLYEHEITSQCAKPSQEHGRHLCWSPTRDKGTTCYCWKTKADRALTRALRVTAVAAAWPTCRHDQVAQLSQVHMCLCSPGNYGKYYCSLLPLTELSALTRGTREPVERQSSPQLQVIFALLLLW